jgi:WD40 repeat protein
MTARFWDAATGQARGDPLPHQDRVHLVAFSPDGKTVLTGSFDHAARLWDAATGEPLGSPLQHQDRVWAFAFSPDSRTVLTGSADRTARFWDAGTGKPVGPPLGHHGIVCAAAFSPDGRTAATGSLDGTARCWATPAPAQGEVERLRLWARLLTGMELGAGDRLRELDGESWRQDRRRLRELGGPPF